MKIKYLATLALAAALLSSCGSGKPTPQEAVRQYVVSFVNAARSGNADSIAAYYAGAEGAKLAPIDITDDAIEVPEPGSDGTVTVKLGDKQLIVTYTPEKTAIVDSKNLFAFSDEDMEFARNTGMLDDKTLDVELRKRLSDTGFRDWLAPTAAQKVKENVKPGGFTNRWVQGQYEGENCWECFVSNSNPVEISGQDYSLRYKVTCAYEIPPSISYETDKGKNLPADGNVKFTEGGGTDDYTISAPTIVWKIPDAEIARKYGRYDGTEYAAYLSRRQ